MKPMTTVLLLTVLAALSGCGTTTIAEVQARPPTFIADTHKTVQSYGTCVIDRWSDILSPNDPVQRFPRANGLIVRSPNGDLVEVTDTFTGAHVEMRQSATTVKLLALDKDALDCL